MGQGGGCGDDYRNQPFCVRHMAGDDADILHYSWSYFEAGGRTTPAWRETMARWGLLMEHSPAMHVVNVAEQFTDAQCGAKFGEALFWERYAPFGANIVCLQTGMKLDGRWGGKEWGHVGNGRHSTTRYGEPSSSYMTDLVARVGAAAGAARTDSLGVVFRNWHPGPLGFQMVADGFAYYYAAALLRALDKVDAAKAAGGDAAAMWPRVPPLLTGAELPVTVACEEEICDVEEPPGCYNFEDPTYGQPQIYIKPASDALNPLHALGLVGAGDTGWERWVAAPNDKIPRAEKALPECAHLDHCSAMRPVSAATPAESGWITFQLPAEMKLGRVFVCCCCGKTCVQQAFFDTEAEFIFDGKALDPATFTQGWPNEKCLVVQDRFSGTQSNAMGHLHLSVKFNKPLNTGGSIMGISHVVAM